VELKEQVKAFWDEAPCGTRELAAESEHARYEELERAREAREPFIARCARFADARGKRLLEVGVGAGTDHLRFARAGAVCTGIDLTEAAVGMTRRRLELEGLCSELQTADAEALPFPDSSFDLVYSWGVIHHSPDTQRAARELLRVLRSGGRLCVMVYNRHSLVAVQTWLAYAGLRGRLGRSLADVLAQHMESEGTQAFTAREAAALFAPAPVQVETFVTAYDMRVGRRRFLPAWTHALVPARLGWFHVVSGSA
jgi:ubiquinone/menaquinone biosynthesis C-methylase UbiE